MALSFWGGRRHPLRSPGAGAVDAMHAGQGALSVVPPAARARASNLHPAPVASYQASSGQKPGDGLMAALPRRDTSSFALGWGIARARALGTPAAVPWSEPSMASPVASPVALSTALSTAPSTDAVERNAQCHGSSAASLHRHIAAPLHATHPSPRLTCPCPCNLARHNAVFRHSTPLAHIALPTRYHAARALHRPLRPAGPIPPRCRASLALFSSTRTPLSSTNLSEAPPALAPFAATPNLPNHLLPSVLPIAPTTLTRTHPWISATHHLSSHSRLSADMGHYTFIWCVCCLARAALLLIHPQGTHRPRSLRDGHLR